MENYLARFNRNSLLLMLTLVTVVVLAATLSYLIWPQGKRYLAVSSDYDTLHKVLSREKDLGVEIVGLRTEVKQLRQALHGDMANLPGKQLEAYVMGQLQELAWQHEIELSGLRPRSGTGIDRFDEMLFEVGLTGHYFDIFDLLIDMDKKLGFVVVKQFRMKPQGGRDGKHRLAVNMTVATYQAAR